MSVHYKNSIFYSLPTEVLIKILNSMDTLTLLKFCEVYKCDYFPKDRSVVKTIDVRKNYELLDLFRISEKIAFEYVTTLNVNCLYWLEAEDLREFVVKLVNLETLYAIQTKLSLTFSDTEVFSKSKIKKLGVSMSKHDKLGNHIIPTVETLYIHVFRVETLRGPTVFEIIFPHLRKLWIDVEEDLGAVTFLQCLNSENKSKIFCQDRVYRPINSEDLWLTTYYNHARVGTFNFNVMCCEKLPNSISLLKIEDCLESWGVLDELQCIPYTPKDARRLFLGEKTLDNIFFEELNFFHNYPRCCSEKYREAVIEILKSPCAQRLQKLCVNMCLLENKTTPKPVDDSFDGSKKRKCIENSSSSHAVRNVFNNFLKLEHLGIHYCYDSSRHSTVQGYLLISLFENLRSLTLDFPLTLDGSFLIEVLKNCKRIETLHIRSTTQHESLNYNLCNAISNATSLKDFRYENCIHLRMDRLIEALCVNQSKKLQRIVLFCTKIDKLSTGRLKKFLEMNPQLVFLYFLIFSCSETFIRMTQETLNMYEERDPRKVLICSKADLFDFFDYPVPDVHSCEILNCESEYVIANLHALEDFETF